MNLQKTIYDPIYGFMDFDKNVLKIIDNPIFNRLRNIKQLGGCYYIWPGASHNRFEHSIGVGHLVDVQYNFFQKNSYIKNQDEFSRYQKYIKIAGLCHDLGHGPLSHAFDDIFLKKCAPNSEYRHHEKRSQLLLNIMYNNYDTGLCQQEIEIIKNIIEPTDVHNYSDYKYSLINNKINSIDLDKFDYIKRDTHKIGVNTSFNPIHLMKMSKIINNKVCYSEKVYHLLYDMYQTRFRLHKEFYHHHASESIEFMFADSLILADKELGISQTISNSDFISITDNILHQIEYSNNNNLQKSREIIKKIRNRDLYCYIGEYLSNCNDELTVDMLIDNIGVDISRDDIIIRDVKFNFTNSKSNPIDNIYFYSHKNHYEKSNETFKIDISKKSKILPNTFEDRIFKIYCKKKEYKHLLQEKLKEINK